MAPSGGAYNTAGMTAATPGDGDFGDRTLLVPVDNSAYSGWAAGLGTEIETHLVAGRPWNAVLRLAPCHVLLAARAFARAMARRAIEEHARPDGASVVDARVVREARARLGR